MRSDTLVLWIAVSLTGVLLARGASGVAHAGPNQGGMLIVHDAGVTYTDGGGAPWPSPVPACDGVDSELPRGVPSDGGGHIWKVYAAFPRSASPRLKALCFGAAFSPSVTVLAGGLPHEMDFELPTAGWPWLSGYGVMISFWSVKTTTVAECYWLAGYGDFGHWELIHHPTQTMMFVDDAFPPVEDQIMGLGSIGFGEPGVTHCPDGVHVGACCLAGGDCQVLEESVCASQGGAFRGTGFPCDPDPCAFGACCFPSGQCFLISPEDCLQVNGLYLGDLSTCEPYPCPSSAPCCDVGVCYFTMTWICEQNGGIPYPDLDSCFPSPCGSWGACCLSDGTCLGTSEAGCADAQGEWIPNVVCWPDNPCVVGGACCLTDGACVVSGESACEDLPGGQWLGPGTSCVPNPCEATPAERSTWGKVKNRFR